MGGRVVGTEAALRAAEQIQSLLGGGIEQRVQAVVESLRTLSDPRVWDGPQAADFRSTYAARHQVTLVGAIHSVCRLGSHAEQVTRSILNAGSQGSLTAHAVPLVAMAPGTQITGDGLPAQGTSPGQVNTWWNSLTPQQQEQYESQDPAQLGALDGIPVDVRDAANRQVLQATQTQLNQQVTQLNQQQDQLHQHQYNLQQELNGLETEQSIGEGGPDVTQQINDVQAQLDSVNNQMAANQQQIDTDNHYLLGIGAIDARLDPRIKPPAYLLGLDTQGSTGHYIVAINNPDHADNVATIVPGVGNNLGDPQWGIDAADNLAAKAGQGDKTSAIVWLNYSPPQSVLAAAQNHGSAQGGAPAFDRFEQGLVVTNDNSQGTGGVGPHLTAIGHSYGSVLVGNASKGPAGSLPVQDVIAVGSPGMDVDNASSFGPGVRVWAGVKHEGQMDPILSADWNAGFGAEPVDSGFGATVFNAELTAPDTKNDAHHAYFDSQSNALANIADIVTGNYDAVQKVPPMPSPYS